MEKRVISTQIQEEDLVVEKSLRPQTLDEYIGQEKAKQNLKVYIEAAKQRGEALDHVLFFGPPGLGKTTLSGIIANEMGTHMKITSAAALAGMFSERASDCGIRNCRQFSFSLVYGRDDERQADRAKRGTDKGFPQNALENDTSY